MSNLIGISPKTLSSRLKELKKVGLISRKVYAEVPLKVEYSLTKEGIEVRDLIIPLMEWAYKKSHLAKNTVKIIK
jgi:DNA-binding HxlR family transcriptional regulator